MKRLLSTILALTIVLSGIGTAAAFASGEPITSTEFDSQAIPFEEDIMSSEAEVDPMESKYAIEADVSTLASKETLPFQDVRGGDWFFQDVGFVYANKVMKGTSPSTFGPGKVFSRAQMVSTLYRISGEPSVGSASNPFKDLDKKEYYYNAVLWAAKNKIVNGVTPTKFSPDGKITREQIAAIFYRYYTGYLGKGAGSVGSLNGFADVNKVSGYAREPLAWAVKVKLMQGISENGKTYLKPKGSTPRSQAASFLTRLCKMDGVMKGYITPDYDPAPTLPDLPKCRTSQKMVSFIKEREGFSANPYWDYSQYSVGYGTYCTDIHGNRITKKSDHDKIAPYYFNISKADAERLLMAELAKNYESDIEWFEKKYKLSFDQSEFDALASFTYNLGASWVYDNCMLNRCLRGIGEYSGGGSDLDLTEAMGVWCRVGGKVAPGTCQRRLRESAVFVDSDYGYNNPRFFYTRYMGNGSYLKNSSYTDGIDYYAKGQTYGDKLLVPSWDPVAGRSSNAEDAQVMSGNMKFAGWYNTDGKQITKNSIVKENEALTAKWEPAS